MRNGITPENKEHINITSNKEKIKPLIKGSVVFDNKDDNLYVADGFKDINNNKFSRVIVENENKKIPEDLIFEGDIVIEKNLKVLGNAIEIPIASLSLEDTIIETNKLEEGSGIKNKRSGVSINRGQKGYANFFYDEIENGFNLCLDNKESNESNLENKTISKMITKSFSIKNVQITEQVIDLKTTVDIEKDIIMVFKSSLFLEEDYYEIKDNKLYLKDILEETTDFDIIHIRLSQKKNDIEIISEDKSFLIKQYKKSITSEENQNSFILPFTKDKRQEVSFVFVNGVFIPESKYVIKNNYLNILGYIDKGSEVITFIISAAETKPENKIRLQQNNELLTHTKNPKELKTSFELDRENSTIILFINSILLQEEEYTINKGNNTINLINYNVSTNDEIEMVQTIAINDINYSERIKDIRTKDSFNNLLTISEEGNAKIKQSLEVPIIKSTENTNLKNVTISEDDNGKALIVNGESNLNGITEVNNLINFNDNTTFNSKCNFHDDVNINEKLELKRETLYLNKGIKKQNGGIQFERKHAPHAIIKWKENIRRWTAGTEGSEKAIITQDALESILDKLMDLLDIESDISTEIEFDQFIIENRIKEEYNFEIKKSFNKNDVILVFINGRFALKSEYNIIGDRIIFNEYLNEHTDIVIMKLIVKQYSLLNNPITEVDKIILKEEYQTIESDTEKQKDFYLNFEVDICDSAILVFMNGLLLNKEMYVLNGTMISLLFDIENKIELTIVSIRTMMDLSFSKLNLISKDIRINACIDNQRLFKIPNKILKDIENKKLDYKGEYNYNEFLVYCNTVLIPRNKYEIRDEHIVFNDMKFIPTEITLVMFSKINFRKSQYNNNESNEICTRQYSIQSKKLQSEFKIPFSIREDSENLIVFYDGKILSKEQYSIQHDMIKLKSSLDKESVFMIHSFLNKSNNKLGINGKNIQRFDLKVSNPEIKSYSMPLTINNKEDTTIVSINGIFKTENDYIIQDNNIEMLCDLKVGDIINIINLANTSTIKYIPVIEEKVQEKIIIEKELDIEWNINHNLKTYPHITLINENNKVIENVIDIIYIDDKNIKVTFSKAEKGKVILS